MKTFNYIKYLQDMEKFRFLQFFADDEGDAENVEKDENEGGNDNDDKNEPPKPRTYTDADVDAIVAKKFAKWQKDHEKDLEQAKEEARKYERMTKEQKEEADRKKAEEETARKDARIKELENQIATDSLRKEVAKDVESMKEGITCSQDFLDLVVTGDADDAKKNVSKLIGIILADRKAQEEKRATGRTPKAYGGTTEKADPYQAILNKYNR